MDGPNPFVPVIYSWTGLLLVALAVAVTLIQGPQVAPDLAWLISVARSLEGSVTIINKAAEKPQQAVIR